MTNYVVSKDKPIEKVIIVGGGDLIIAAYILKQYPNVKKLIVSDIDERVPEVTKKFFSFASCIDEEIKNGRLEFRCQSGADYLEECLKNGEANKIGALIVDCTDFALDENSIAAELFTP